MQENLTTKLTIRIGFELKAVIDQFCQEHNLNINEFLAARAAVYLKRPDLAKIPWKKMGRRVKAPVPS